MDISEIETLHREITHTEADLQALFESTAIALDEMQASTMSIEDGASIHQFLTELSSKVDQLYMRQGVAGQPRPPPAAPALSPHHPPPATTTVPGVYGFPERATGQASGTSGTTSPGTRFPTRREGLPVVAVADRLPHAASGPQGAPPTDAAHQPRQSRILHDAGDPGALLHGVRCGLHRPRDINAPENRDIAALLNRI
ncbi:hypothetical protein NESM_000539900 [Novymonas esmeraldas]|uniref:Uncharacterized protein n=1 Tax=Novymonas esmeraldas TaxID=1808958 RepID=A0AAW0EPU0_9TRYP